MTIRVAITGFGRIGRNVLRAHYENNKKHDIEIVAINMSGDFETNAHLLKYDTTHGRALRLTVRHWVLMRFKRLARLSVGMLSHL